MSKNQNNFFDTVFETVDPQNNYVSLSRGVWEEHIIKNHPELKSKEHLVLSTIENPHYITTDADIENRYYYMENTDKELKLWGKKTKVVVSVDSASVKSAYPTDKTAKGERTIWKK